MGDYSDGMFTEFASIQSTRTKSQWNATNSDIEINAANKILLVPTNINGKVGIGTIFPDSKLHVNGNITLQGIIKIYNTQTNSNGYFWIEKNNLNILNLYYTNYTHTNTLLSVSNENIDIIPKISNLTADYLVAILFFFFFS